MLKWAILIIGKVFLLDINTNAVIDTLNGQQPGEHFGASLAMTDFNGDGLNDIIVGAPHHTNFKSSEFRFEIGAVYSYQQQSRRIFKSGSSGELILKGQTSGSRFGLAVAALGDANADGFNDLVIKYNFKKILYFIACLFRP